MKNPYEDYQYFYKLLKINSLYFKEDNVRITDRKILLEIDDLIHNIYLTMEKEKNINTIIRVILNSIGKVLYMQPFHNGNSRTLKQFIKVLLNSIDYDIYYNRKDYIIPLLFDNEECNNEEIQFFKVKAKLRKKKK